MHGYVEVSLRSYTDSGEIFALLNDGAVLGAWEKDGALFIYWPEEKWTAAVREDLEQALAALRIDGEQAGLAIRVVPDTDWNATWAASLHPIRLGRRLRIRQSWHPSDPGFDGIELVIDPKRAFGTGYHTTTQLVIEWLEDHIRGGERVLDVGTGSGILAMTAIRLGAVSALGIDDDPVALECAREYCRENHFGCELELRAASFEDLDPCRYDMIVANLDGRTLPLLCAALPRLLEAGGIACLSGLQQQDCDGIVEALAKAGFQINARAEREDWLALEVSGGSRPR